VQALHFQDGADWYFEYPRSAPQQKKKYLQGHSSEGLRHRKLQGHSHQKLQGNCYQKAGCQLVAFLATHKQ